MKNPEKALTVPAPPTVDRYRAYYLKNRARLQAAARARYVATRDRRRASMADYNATHCDEIKARKAIYYASNQVRLRAYARDRYASRKLAAVGLELVAAKKGRP